MLEKSSAIVEKNCNNLLFKYWTIISISFDPLYLKVFLKLYHAKETWRGGVEESMS